MQLPEELLSLLSTVQTNDIKIYTDGSYKPQLRKEGLHEPTTAHSAASIVIPLNDNTWPNTRVATLRVTGESFLSNSYQAELLAATIAATLPTNATTTTIVTDCQSIVQQTLAIRDTDDLTKINRNDQSPYLTALTSSTAHLQWVKAHTDTIRAQATHDQLGNQIADAVARDIDLPHTPCEIHQYTMPLTNIWSPHKPCTLLTHESAQLVLPSNKAIQKHICAQRLNTYLKNRHQASSSQRNWENLSWNSTGYAFRSILKTMPPSLQLDRHQAQRYFFMIIYDKFRNEAYKHRNANTQLNPEEAHDTPACPLCNMEDDSMSHLLCQCSHEHIRTLRQECLSAIVAAATREATPFSAYSRFYNSLTGTDGRAWACLVDSQPDDCDTNDFQIPAQFVLPYTLSTAYAIWKYYCAYTHPKSSSQPVPVPQPTVHRVIARTGRIATRPGPLPAPMITRKKSQRRQIPPSHAITKYFQTTTKSASNITTTHKSPKQSPQVSPVIQLHNTFDSLTVDELPNELPDVNIPNRHSQPVSSSIDDTPLQSLTLQTAQTELAQLLNANILKADGSKGDCLINAVKIGLSKRRPAHNPLQLNNEHLRRIICKHLKTTRNGLDICDRHFVTTSMIDDILPKQVNTWLELWGVEALQSLLAINITVHHLSRHRDGTYGYTTQMLNHITHRDTIQLLHSGNNHFDLLHPCDFEPP
jgi:hypothetical protein